MLGKIDNFLNSITMYRLVLYYLILLIAVAFIFSIFHLLPFTPVALIFSTLFLTVVCFIVNKIFEKIFNTQINTESLYITALILALIFTPFNIINLSNISILFLVAFLAMASKFILNIGKIHIFNPAAISAVMVGFLFNNFASWWIGTLVMFPFSLLGILIVRKIRHFDLVFYFFVGAFISIFGLSFLKGNPNIISILRKTLIDTPILFFAFVMLTEPLTSPPTSLLQSIYGGLVGFLFAPQFHFGPIFTTPELALSIGNVFSYIVSPKIKLVLKLKDKVKLTSDIYDFVFTPNEKINFKAGEYLEWTFGHKNTDSRGNRRYFSIASSPTESDIRIGVKFNQDGSSYKREMLSMQKEATIVASQLAGDFTLIPDKNKKLVFIAGGIGITPFRSMIKYMIDTNEKRDIILIYCEKDKKEMVYKDIFEEANNELRLKIIYFETSKLGHIKQELLVKYVPDFKERIFYLSGSDLMVHSFEKMLKEINLPRKQLKLDYFPGF